jgi:DNA-directed RNA polymerase specialized sigma24 family protein
MGYVVRQKSHIDSELGLLMPRLRSFAAALTGSEARTQELVKAARNQILARMAKERGHTPLPLWAFAQTQKLWANRMKRNAGVRPDPVDPRLFQPRSRVNDGGASARFAMRIAQLGPQQRGTLHLVYGERLSYDEVAEIFDVPVSAIISRLAKCHAQLAQAEERDAAAPDMTPRRPQTEAEARRQGWAA